MWKHLFVGSWSYSSVCDGTQNVGRYRYRYFFPVPNIFDTDTGTFFGTEFFRYRFQNFFSIPNFTDTGSETFFRYQFFPIPVPIPPEKINNSPYQYRYLYGTHHKSLVPNFGNGNQDFHYEHKEFALNSKKIPRRNMRITRFERYKYIMKKLSCYDLLRQGQQNCEIGTKFFSVPNIFDSSSKTFSGTKFFRYRFRDFFPVPNFSDTGSETFFRYQFVPIPVPIPPKKWKIPGTGNSRYRSHSAKEWPSGQALTTVPHR